jgi:hypothetical protein
MQTRNGGGGEGGREKICHISYSHPHTRTTHTRTPFCNYRPSPSSQISIAPFFHSTHNLQFLFISHITYTSLSSTHCLHPFILKNTAYTPLSSQTVPASLHQHKYRLHPSIIPTIHTQSTPVHHPNRPDAVYTHPSSQPSTQPLSSKTPPTPFCHFK